MQLIPYLNFPGTCREAVTAYADILRCDPPMILGFDSLPEEEKAHLPPAIPADAVMNATVMKDGKIVLYASDDMRPEPPAISGSAVNVTVGTPDEARRIWDALSPGGEVRMPLGETFWSPAFGMLVDRFGVPWMVMAEGPEG